MEANDERVTIQKFRALQLLWVLVTYIYDLSAEWHAMTGLPFVFAVWASVKPMDEEWRRKFNIANAMGLQKLDVIAEAQKFSFFDLKKYYRHHITFEINNERKTG